MEQAKPTAGNPRVVFNACTTRGDKCYIWESYKGFAWARKKVREKMSYYGSDYDGWYIERQKTWYDDEGKIRVSGVIVAQSRDTQIRNRFKRIQ